MREKRILDTWDNLDKAVERLMKAETLGDVAKRNAWDNVNDQMRKLKSVLEIEVPRPRRTTTRRKKSRRRKALSFDKMCSDLIKKGYTTVDSMDEHMPWLLEVGVVRVVRADEDDWEGGQQSFIPVWAAQCKNKTELLKVKRSPKLRKAMTTAFHLGLTYVVQAA